MPTMSGEAASLSNDEERERLVGMSEGVLNVKVKFTSH